MRLRSFSALAVVLLLAPGVPAAELPPARATLAMEHGEGTSECLSKPELERAVEERLKRPVFSGKPDLVLDVRLTRGDGAFRIEVLLGDANGVELGRRELVTEAKHCSSLDDSLALVVALLVDAPPAPPTPATPEPARPEPKAPQRPTTPVTLPKKTHAPREPLRIDVWAGGAALAGRLPGVAFGPRAGVGITPPELFEVRLSIGAFLPVDQRALAADGGASFSLLEASLEVCPVSLETRTVQISGCFGQSVGRVRAEGFGFLENRRFGRLDLVLTAGASIWVELAGPLGLRAAVVGGAPLARDTYVAESADGETVQVFEPAPVLGAADLGLGLRF